MTRPLGKLAPMHEAVSDWRWPRNTGPAARTMLKNILKRMAEIDAAITDPSGDGSKDRPPTGDDYNLLWDAILDEINAAVQS